METSALRRKLSNGEIDPQKKAMLQKEYEYFASISPKSLFDRFKRGGGEKKTLSGGQVALLVVGALIGIPLLIGLTMVYFPLFVLLALIVISIWRRWGQSPEYRAYDFRQRIAEPTLRLFDEKLEMAFHSDCRELGETGESYEDALVSAYLVKPIHRRSDNSIFSCCSYDWADSSDKDSFEFMGCRIFHEWEDDDGDKHVDTYFDGCIYKFHTSFMTSGVINIMSTETKKNIFGIETERNRFKRIKDKKTSVIDTENHEFAENFDTIADYDEEAYRYLTPAMIENLLELRKDCFFCICIKGNVMTVAVDNGGFRDAGQSAFDDVKKGIAPENAADELDRRIVDYRDALKSVYELKDILDPGGRN